MNFIIKMKDGIHLNRTEMQARQGPVFTLFPMMHIADRTFYDVVKQDADAHDLVMYEAFNGPMSTKPLPLTAEEASQKLIGQNKILRPNGATHWWYTDTSRTEMRTALRGIPIHKRLALTVAAAVMAPLSRFGWFLRWMQTIADDDDVAKAPLTRNSIVDLFGEEATQFVLDSRDARLAAHCDSIMQDWSGCRVAVIWGVAHMPALLDHLRETHGYQVADQRWMRAIAAE